MNEQLPPDLEAAQKNTGKYLYFLLAAGLCLALIYLGQKPRRAITPPAAGAAAARAPEARPLPAAPAMKPLGRSLEGITTRYKKMKPGWIEPILSGPLEGGTVRKYTIGDGTDDLTTLGDAVYRRVLSFRLAQMVEQFEGTHANFSGLVFTHALYPSAFDRQDDATVIPPELQKLADAFGEKCGALAEPGARTAEHRETHDGYVFYCSNKDTTRLIYGVCSEGLLAAEAAAGK
jgi:hypothetical protein